MNFPKEHEIHKRRMGRNLGVGLVLAAFIAIVFGLTIAKINNGGQVQGLDHSGTTVTEADQ
ncbi:MAG: hypothetical protein P8L68_15640 [Paracoccaceae bacterium]|nr:hypothetical protein [Paracoccaceae bacterium]MDG2259916.1 hypothetical protein [Paracoccaceae bacterium]